MPLKMYPCSVCGGTFPRYVMCSDTMCCRCLELEDKIKTDMPVSSMNIDLAHCDLAVTEDEASIVFLAQDAAGRKVQQVLRFKDEHIKRKLRELGWLDPESAKKLQDRIEELEEEMNDDTTQTR